jgi:hypothetical protein
LFLFSLIYKEEIKQILSQFRLSFDELDSYCESNEWLCEINRFCLQWTPNQMKQMSEGKQVFLIEVSFKNEHFSKLSFYFHPQGAIKSSSRLD